MALTNADYKLTLTGFFEGETANPIENVFWWKADQAGGTAQDLATQFVNTIVPEIAKIVAEGMVFSQVEVINLVDLQDFTIATFGVAGLRSAFVANRWDAFAFQYLRPIRGMNNGSKRFGPIAKADYENQQAVTSLGVTLDLVSDALESGLEANLDVTYLPACVKTHLVANQNGNGKFHYEPLDLFVCNSVAYQGVSHQDSRGS